MKTLIGHLILFSGATALPALGASPTLAKSPPAKQDLTLLPGPYLTSPAKAPQPNSVRPEKEHALRFGPEADYGYLSNWSFRPATLSVVGAPERRPQFGPAPKPVPPVNPETLRFESQLPSSARRSILERTTPPAAPKRD